MNVTTDQIREIKAGQTALFQCDEDKMFSVASILSYLKRHGMPKDVVGYEHKKFFGQGHVIIRALKEGDIPVFK